MKNKASRFTPALSQITAMSEETLLEFPCRFAIKAMGKTSPDLEILVIETIRRHSPGITEDALTLRPSKGGNYTSVTVVIEAYSKRQLDSIYRDLSSHPHILMVL